MYGLPKQCWDVKCSNVFVKGSGLQFYQFPADVERNTKQVTAVNREGLTDPHT